MPELDGGAVLAVTMRSHGMLLAGQFVLGVWNSRTDWRDALGLEGPTLPREPQRPQ